MAENLNLSKEDKVAIDFSMLLNSFILQYAKHELNCIDGNAQIKHTFPKEWMDLLGDITKSKYGLKGYIIIQDKRSFEIVHDLLIKEDDIIDDNTYYDIIYELEERIDMLCDKKVIGVDKDDSYSIACEIAACYFHRFVTFNNHSLYYTDGDIFNIASIVTEIFNSHPKEFILIPPLFLPELLKLKPKYRIELFVKILDHIDQRKIVYNYTYVGVDSSGMFKIGKTSNISRRSMAIKTHNPSYKDIILIKGDFEKELHNKFSVKRVSGEWFHLSEKDLEYIASNYEILLNKKL